MKDTMQIIDDMIRELTRKEQAVSQALEILQYFDLESISKLKTEREYIIEEKKDLIYEREMVV